VVVAGDWLCSGPGPDGYMVVTLRGRSGGRVACHFEDVPAASGLELEGRLLRADPVIVSGRHGGTAGVLRGCRLID
jgi:hypothetical protein